MDAFQQPQGSVERTARGVSGKRPALRRRSGPPAVPEQESVAVALDATLLLGAAPVVRDRGVVFDRGHADAGGGEAVDGGFTPGAGAGDADLDLVAVATRGEADAAGGLVDRIRAGDG